MIIAATIVDKKTNFNCNSWHNKCIIWSHSLTLKQYTTPFCLNYNSLVTWKNTRFFHLFSTAHTHSNKKLITSTHSHIHTFFISICYFFSKAVIIITIRSYNPFPIPLDPQQQQKYTHTQIQTYNYTLLQ